ncbi:unnamed protein product [Rotaria sp. Silwood1]|nr:unnamed protein product [Rotaria sp. Silwood1]CAF1602845.1 unnamed protein product [Rotaria sp. Silwood1]CAF3708782.1 unnamed protein product [Rotaria sp. Silwood1]CAF3874695.1 unnamed protein product [Rotaria sp. Silwood1]CAF4929048.1 unnamed protein product [Rotaria sp. Silwood1]
MNLRRSISTNNTQITITKMSNHHQQHHSILTRNSTNDFNETIKKTPSPRRQMTRSTSNLNKDISSSINNNNNNEQCIQVIKPVAVRPPSSDSTQNPYNLRSRTKLKNSTNNNTEVIPSFTEKLSLETPIIQQKPVPPLTRAAAASAGVKIDSFISDESIKTNNKLTTTTTTISTRSSTTRKRKASEDDHRPYLDLLKMKQTQSTYSFDGNSPKKMTKRADQDCIGVDDEDSGCDYDSPAHSPVDFTDVPPGHVFHYEESNMSYDSGFSTGSGEQNKQQYLSQCHTISSGSNSSIITRSSTLNSNKYPAAIDLDVNAIEGDLGF